MSNAYKLVISLVVCQLIGLIGSIYTMSSIPTWYAALEKPAFTPPNWLFAPAWITLYVLMGIAAFLVWRNGWDKPKVRAALAFFGVQLVLNALWSVAFFGLESPLFGLVVIVLLWVAILITMLRFKEISIAGAWLLLPYLLWVTFTGALNIAIWMLN